MAFSLYLDETCLSTSCTYVEYSVGLLQWIDSNTGNGEYTGTVYKDNKNETFTYEGPEDLYLTTTQAVDPIGPTGPTGGTNPGGTLQPWDTTIEYWYGTNNLTTFFQENYPDQFYPSGIENIKSLSLEKLISNGETTIIIHFVDWDIDTTNHYSIKIPAGLKFSNLEGAVFNTEYDSLKPASNIKIHFSIDTDVTYKVNVSANPSAGGTVSKSPSYLSYKYLDEVTIKAIPKAGYTWNKWIISNLSNNTTTSTTYTFNVINDHTCTAYFTANKYTVKFNANGGSGSMSDQSFTYGVAQNLNTNKFTRNGYNFAGWNTKANGAGTNYSNKQSVNNLTATNNGTVTLYAKWTPTPYTIKYYIGGVEDTSLGNPSTYTIETQTITLIEPTKSNYTGSGWRLNSTSGTQYTQIVKGSTGNKTFYWTWSANSYNIIYKDKGGVDFSGTHASGYPTKHTYGTATTLKTASKTGYTFGGWFTSSDCSGSAISSIGATAYTSNIILYAKWTAKTITITWNPNGGSVSPTSNTYTYNGTGVTLPSPTRTGYTFNGWYTASSGGTKITEIGTTNKPTSNVTYYAHWGVNSYTLSWNANGGTIPSSPAYTSGSVKYGATITKPSNPTRTGYSFNGWKDQNGNTTVVTTMPAKALTYTAQWTIDTYTITYNLNGGTNPNNAKTSYNVTTTTFNLPTPTKTDYTFKGWYGNNQFSGSQITQITKGSTGNKQFWAKWEGNACTITVNANPSYLSEYVSGGKSCKVGDNVTISASVPGDYIAFNSWTCGNTFESSSNPYTFTAPGTRTYTGNFTDYRQKITFKFHVNPQHYTDTPDTIVDIFYGDTRAELSQVRRTLNGSNIVYEIDSNTDVRVNKYAGGSGTYLSLINGSLNSQGMYYLPSTLDSNNIVGIYIGKNPTTDSETYKENELVLDVYYGKLPSFSTPGGDSGSSIPSKQLQVKFNYLIDGIKLEKGTATWESKWGGYTPTEEIETWWIQYNGFDQDKKDFNKNRIYFTHHEIGDYNYNSINDTPTQLQEKLEIQAPINCYVDSVCVDGVNGDVNGSTKEYNTLTNTSGTLVVDINYKNVTYLAKATSSNTSRGDAKVNDSGINGSTDVEFIIGQQLTFNALPKTGYKFTKWVNKNNTSQEYTTNPYIIENAPAANVHYEASFGPNEYTIELNPNGGSGSQSSVKVDYYSTSLKSTITNPTRTGYTFNGWYTAPLGNLLVIGTDGKLKSSVSGFTDGSSRWIKASNTTVYAHWTGKTITITWDPNGGYVTPTTSQYIYNGESITPPTPTRTGYTFSGWYTAVTGGTKITDIGITNKPAENVTYYAHWEGNPCTITVNANPSELTSRLTGGGNYRIGDSVTITAPSSYAIYKFKNWAKNNFVVSTSSTYTFTANGNETYVANFIDNRKSALFKIHVLDDTYTETSLCEVEIKYGDLENPSEDSIKRAGNVEIEIDGPSSTYSVTKTHKSGTNILDNFSGTVTPQSIYVFPESINNEPFINILYNGNTVKDGVLYTNNSLEFDVYYGNLPKPEEGDDSDNQEITVRFKYYLDNIEIDTSNAEYISWPTSNIDELKCYWFKYDGYTQNDRELAITGITDRIQFSYVDTYWGDPAKSDPYSNLKYILELEAPMYTGLTDPILKIEDIICTNTEETYNYKDCTDNILDVSIYFKSYEFDAYVYSNLPEYGDAYIAQKGKIHTIFHASSVRPTPLRFDAEVLNDAFYFNRWVNYNTKTELSTENPWIINRPEGHDYHVEAEFLGRQINIKLDPNNDKAEAFWQRVGIVAGTNKFKKISFDADEPIKSPDAKTGYEFLGWYTSETNNNGSGDLIIDKNGNLQANVSGWTSSDGLWIKGPDEVSPGLIVDVVVYAKWKPIEYTITLEPNGGSGSQQTVEVDYLSSSLKSAITNPTRTGFTFNGWYTTASGGSPVIGTDKKLKANVSGYTDGSSRWIKASGATLYAYWTPNKYTLTWDLNGGTVTTAGTCAPLDSTGIVSGQVEYLSNITAPIVLKNGYNFLGWSANGVDVITPASKMPNGNLKYIAVYSTKTYKISVNSIPTLDKVYIKVNGENKGVTTTCTTGDAITLVAENTIEYVLSYWKKSSGDIVSGKNEFIFTANDTYLDDTIDNNIFTAYYNEDPSATLKINFIVDDIIEKTAILKFDTTFSFLGDSSTEGYRCEIQGEPECIVGDISINQGYFFIPSKYNEKDICMVPNEQGTETTKLICSNKGETISYDGHGSQYYADNTTHNSYCPTGFEWQAYLPTNNTDETHLVFPIVEKEENGVLYGPLVIDVYYGEIPERFLPVVPEDIEITTVSGLTLLQRIQNKIATFKWLNNLFGEPEKTSWDSYDNSGLKSFLKDDSKETPSSMHCIEYGDLQIYNQDMDDESINCDKTIKQYSFTSDATIIKPLNGQVVLDVSKIEGNKIYFNILNLNGFANTSNGIYIYFSVNNETDENNATLYKMKLPKTPNNKGLLLTIPNVSNIESLYIYRTPIMVDSTKTGITPKILFSSEKGNLSISVYDRTTLNTVI